MTSATLSPPRPPRRRGRSPLAVLLVTSALLGSGTTAGILAVTGSLGGSATTTVIQRAAAATSSASSGGLNASALYASTSPGVVDISVDNGSGTGFVIGTQGHIVTAAHVVDGSRSVTVKLGDGTTRKATVLGIDNSSDVALIRIDPSGLTLHPVTLGSSASTARSRRPTGSRSRTPTWASPAATAPRRWPAPRSPR